MSDDEIHDLWTLVAIVTVIAILGPVIVWTLGTIFRPWWSWWLG
mgnify:CR=1 FL=1